MRRYQPVRLLPIGCAGGAVMLAASSLMDMFHLNGAGAVGETNTLAIATATDQHGYSTMVLAVFALIALIAAVLTGSKPAAAAVAVSGAASLLIFLLIDLPDAGVVGSLSDTSQNFLNAKAQPANGFWIELIGALLLSICGAALATFTPDQLRQLIGGGGLKKNQTEAGKPAAPKAKTSEAEAETSAAGGAKAEHTNREAARAEREKTRATGDEPQPNGRDTDPKPPKKRWWSTALVYKLPSAGR